MNENLSKKKTKHPSKGEKKVQDGRTPVLANQESSNDGRPLGEHELKGEQIIDCLYEEY
jgi:hypothetical protein